MTEIDVARIRADMARNQYAEPEDTEALIVALDEARGEIENLDSFADAICERYVAEMRNAKKAELDARNMQRERDAAHIEVAARTAERDEERAKLLDDEALLAENNELATQLAEERTLHQQATAELAAARAELEAFAKTRVPAGLDVVAVTVLTRVTAPFIARMRAALGGAQ